MGLTFDSLAADVDESAHPGEGPVALARRLSLAKAEAAQGAGDGDTVVGCDTLVILDGCALGKPSTQDGAVEMLVRLRGREHKVCSGLTVIDRSSGRRCLQTVLTSVYMRDYSDHEIRRYAASGDPLERAGSYAIQHADFAPVTRLQGCWANVVGLPICHLYRVLRTWRVAEPVHPLVCCPRALADGGCTWAEEILAASEDAWEG